MRALLLTSLVTATACFAPPWAGEGELKCAATEPQCPPGLVCVAGGCWYPDVAPDAGLDLSRVGDLKPAPMDLVKPMVAIGWDNPMPGYGVVKLATTATRTFRVVNTGVDPLSSIQVTTLGDAAFAISSNGCTGLTLAADEGCDVMVGFSPTVKQTYSGVLRAEANGKQASLTLSGAGGNPVTLTVAVLGTGSGSVTALGGISCATGTCMFTVEAGDALSLNSAPNAGSTFEGWSGDAASCGTTSPCALTMDADKSIAVSYAIKSYPVTLRKYALTGATGTLSLVAGTNMSSIGPAVESSTVQLPHGAYTITAQPDGAATVLGWPSGCGAHETSCTVMVDQAKTFTVVLGPPSNYVFSAPLGKSPGTLGSVPAADLICQNAALAAGLADAGTYVAWLSSASQDAKARLAGARGWVRTDGLPFADTVDSFTTGKVVWYPPILSAVKGQYSGQSALTGTKADGTHNASATCNQYSSTTGTATTGNNGYGYPSWTESFWSVNCADDFAVSVYCFGTAKTATLTLPTAPPMRKAFVTSTSHAIEADFITKVDAACATQGGSANYKALITPAGASAMSRFDLTKALWARPDGVPLQFDLRALFATTPGPLLPLDFDATGMRLGSVLVWTGNDDLTASTTTYNCGDWMSTTGGVRLGIVDHVDPFNNVLSISSSSCNTSFSILCLEN